MNSKVRKPTPASQMVKSKEPITSLVGHMIQYDEFLQKKYPPKPRRKAKTKKTPT